MIKHIKQNKVMFGSIGVVLIVLVANVVFIEKLSPYFDVYFGLLLLTTTALGTIVSGVFFIKGRILNLRELPIVAVFFAGYVINWVIATGFLNGNNDMMHRLLHVFMAYGQFYFAAGLFFILSKKSDKNIVDFSLKNLKGIVGVMLLMELLSVVLYMSGIVSSWGIESVVNIMATMIFMRIFIDQLSRQDDLKALFPIGTFVIAQSYLVIVPRENVLIHFEVSWLILLGVWLILRSEISVLNRIYKNHNQALYRQFNIYSQNLQKLVDKKTLEIKDANQEIINELEYAKVIQQSLLPPRHYSYRDTIFMSAYYPCERLSGDFYDIFRIDDEYIALYYMDVAGHGISAALLTMLSNNFLRATDHHFKRLWVQRPDKNLKLLYDHFNTLGLPDEMHLVIFYATYNLATHVLTYCSGGMNCAPIVFRQNGTYELLEQSDGFPICKMEDVFTPIFSASSIVLKTGDRVVFYTDGLTDLEKNKIFDEEDLIAFSRKHRKKSIREFNTLLEERISPFKDDLNDDLTYIIMDI